MSKADTKVITIGRAADNIVVLDTANVSAHHARLTVSPNRIVLEDLKSTNGTSVRTVENKTQRAIVNREDFIFLGSAEYSVAEILQLADQSLPPAVQTSSAADKTHVAPPAAIPNAVIAVFAVVIAVAVLWFSIWQDGEQAADIVAATINEAAETEIDIEESGLQTMETAAISQARPAVSDAAAKLDVTDAMFVVFCREAETNTPFRVGTAFAIDDGRVITSASVIYSLRKLMELSFTEPTLYSPAQKRSFAITKMIAHPQFEETTARIDVVRGTPTSDRDDQIIALLNQRTVFDVGTLQTNEQLVTGLKLHSEDPRPGQKLRVIGYPFDVDDPFFDASLTLQADRLTVRSAPLLFFDGLSAAAFAGQIDGTQADQTNLAFIGSPILDANDRVIGVYVRQTPSTQGSDRFDGSLASQLQESLSE